MNIFKRQPNDLMKLVFKVLISILLIIGFSPFDSQTSSANYNEIEILSDEESEHLSKIIAGDVVIRLDSLIDAFSQHQRFSGNILVAVGGNDIYSRSVGFADPLRKESVNQSTVFQLASVSKQFTAAAIMLLKSDGRLDFTDSLVKFIPELPYREITISHLLHHMSGLPNYMYLIDKFWNDSNAPDNEDVIDLMARHKLPLFFKPGAQYDYSNTGYMMLATVVQRISGLSLNEFLQRRLFKPLGMNNTYVYSSVDTNIVRKQIDGFRSTRRGYYRIADSHHDGSVGDKGVCSTIEDLSKWDKALYNGFPISNELVDMAFEPATTLSGKVIPYGQGFRLRESNGTRVVYHNGIWEGARTNFHRFIDQESTIIVLNNTSISSNHELVRLIENTLMQEKSVVITSKISQLVIEEGLDSALDYFSEISESEPFLHPDIRKFMQAADYMYSIGKDKKAEDFKKLCEKMVSI